MSTLDTFSQVTQSGTFTGAALLENNEASAELIPLQMAERLLRAQPDSAANHVTARLISG